MFKKLLCDHDYVLIQNFTMESEFDIVKKAGYKPMNYHNLERLHVTDFKCSKCGKLKRKKARN